jgi:hypothetical protein
MKKPSKFEDDDMSREIDFSRGERGRFAERFAEGTNRIPLAPQVLEVSANAESVNGALRLIAQVAVRSPRLEKTP